jgi:hypothetical protein
MTRSNIDVPAHVKTPTGVAPKDIEGSVLLSIDEGGTRHQDVASPTALGPFVIAIARALSYTLVSSLVATISI